METALHLLCAHRASSNSLWQLRRRSGSSTHFVTCMILLPSHKQSSSAIQSERWTGSQKRCSRTTSLWRQCMVTCPNRSEMPSCKASGTLPCSGCAAVFCLYLSVCTCCSACIVAQASRSRCHTCCTVHLVAATHSLAACAISCRQGTFVIGCNCFV